MQARQDLTETLFEGMMTEKTKTVRVGAWGVLFALGSGLALQSTEVIWAADFLSDYGWLGLFLLSFALNAYLFRQVNKVRDAGLKSLEELRVVHDKELKEQRARHDREIERAEAQLQATLDKLLEEYKIRIAVLSQQQE